MRPVTRRVILRIGLRREVLSRDSRKTPAEMSAASAT